MTIPTADEPARDAHLRTALRHAPDAELAAPEALHQNILRAARAQSTSSTNRTSGPTLGARIGAWLAVLTRPPMASGMAGLMVALLGGWIWWGQPLDIRQPMPEVAEAPARSTPPRPAPAEPKVATAPQAEPPAPSVAVKARPARESRAVADAPRLPVPVPVPVPVPKSMAPPTPHAQADAAREAAPAAKSERELAAGAAPPTAPPAVASTAPAPIEARDPRAEAESRLNSARRAERARVAPAAASPAPSVQAPAPAFARPPAPMAQGAHTLHALRQQIQAAPADWRAQLSLGLTQTTLELRVAPHVATLLDTLQALTGDRWQSATRAEASPADPTPQALLLLQAPSGATHAVRLHTDRIEWLRPDAAPVQAPLSADQATAARRAFEVAAMR